MAVEVTARHMNASVEMQEYARGKAGQLMVDFPRIEHIHVIMDIEKHRHIAEMVVQAKRHIRLESREVSDNMRVSVDMVSDKIEKQLRRLLDKAQEHRPHHRNGQPDGGKAP
jgi:putative sigma-54 modulation protein